MKLLSKTLYSNVYNWENQRVIKMVNKKNQVAAKNEIKLLTLLKDSPYVVNIDFTYENEHNIYMVLEYCKHGCMYDNHTILKENRLRQVLTSMLMCILECHKYKILHGDINLQIL
jgi:serine/threonine protein kinase